MKEYYSDKYEALADFLADDELVQIEQIEIARKQKLANEDLQKELNKWTY